VAIVLGLIQSNLYLPADAVAPSPAVLTWRGHDTTVAPSPAVFGNQDQDRHQ
jgi:hypothetical protein